MDENNEVPVQAVGEEVGPFRVVVTWKPEATAEEVQAAQEFIAGVNLSDNNFMPACIDAIFIKRI